MRNGTSTIAGAWAGEIERHLKNDLNTPAAQSALLQLSSKLRSAINSKDDALALTAYEAVLKAGDALGVLASEANHWFSGGADDALKAEVEALLAERVQARADKNWAEADRIRDRLTALNVVVMDGPTGATWRMKD